MPGQLFTYFIMFFFLIYIAMSCILFALKSSAEICLFSYTLTFIMCIFLYHSCSCHCGLFHSGVLSCIFWTLGYFIQTCIHLVLSWFSHFWQKNGFVDAFGFPQPHPLQALILDVTVMDTFLLCASSTSSIAQFFCLRAFPKAKGADPALIWGWDEVSCCSSDWGESGWVQQPLFIWRNDSGGKESACNVGYQGSIPESERSPGEENGNTFQHSCLESPVDREDGWATVHGVAKSQTRLRD